MSEFVSTEGLKVATLPTGALLVDGRLHIASVDVGALREFFRHERDTQLGRWRWPENPAYVVYHARDEGDGVHWSVDERTGESHMNTRAGLQSDEHGQAARAYFDTHPEPKPWHEAKCGESWYLEPFDIVYTCVGDDPNLWFTRSNVYDQVEKLDRTDPRITRGRRIWPEATS